MKTKRLITEGKMSEAELLALDGAQVAVFSNSCPPGERTNQDSAAVVQIDEQTFLLVVADGMGGGRAGDKASKLAIQSIVESAQQSINSGDLLRGAILDGFERANKKVVGLGVGAGTTLSVVEIKGDEMRCYHVGDSVVLSLSQRGTIKFQSLSHSPVGYALEAGVIEEDEALKHEERHIVSNIVGSPDMRIDIGPSVKIAARDTIILASDGLFDNLSTSEVIELVRKGPLPDVMQTLIHDCTERMNGEHKATPSKPDDLTFITFRRQ